MSKKFSRLFIKESTQKLNEMEFKPPGEKEVNKPAPVVDNSGVPKAEPVGHIEHPAPGLTEPKTVVTTVPAGKATESNPSKITEAQVDTLIEALKVIKESFTAAVK